jgi:hypothetical protein
VEAAKVMHARTRSPSHPTPHLSTNLLRAEALTLSDSEKAEAGSGGSGSDSQQPVIYDYCLRECECDCFKASTYVKKRALEMA